MQLFLKIDTDVNIQRKMTAIEQESLSLPEKFTNKEIIDKGNDDNVNVVNENSITNTLGECVDNKRNLKNKEYIDSNSENLNTNNLDNYDNRDSNKEVFNNSGVEVSSSSIENVPTHPEDSNISRIQKEDVDHKINRNYENDEERNTNLKNDEIDLVNRVEENETNIEIKVDIEVKKESLENEQKIDPITHSENKESSENNVDTKTSTSSTSEETPVNGETNIIKSVMNSNDRNDLKTNIELDTKREICDETGEINVTEKNDIKSLKEDKVEKLHAIDSFHDDDSEMFNNENDKILEESIMDDSDEMNSDDIVFKGEETLDENMSIGEIKSDVELCEKEPNLELSNHIKNELLEIESSSTSCEKVYSELQTTSNLEQSPVINTNVQIRDDVIKIKNEVVKHNKEVKEIDISDAIDDVNKHIKEAEISDEIIDVNKEIGEKGIRTSDNLNNINKSTVEKEFEIVQMKELGINVEESTNVETVENNVNKEIKEKELSDEMIEVNKKIEEIDGKSSDKENKIKEIKCKELEINVEESTKVTPEDNMEVNEPDLLVKEEISKTSDELTKTNEIVVEKESQIIQSEGLESTTVTSDENMEVNEPDLFYKEEISKNNEVTQTNETVVEKESQIIQSKETEINAEELANVTRDENMEVIELKEADLVQKGKVSSDNEDVIAVDEQVIDDAEKSSNFINDEIIDIADEIFDVEDIPEKSSDSLNKFASIETEIEKNDIECEKANDIKGTENKSEMKSVSKDDKLTNNEKNIEKTKTIEKKKLSHICKLSNTLDILSDDDEEEEEDLDNAPSSFEKNCINIEDDDDIMLIDEETTTYDCKNVVELENNEDRTEESVEDCNTNLKENEGMDVCESRIDNKVELRIEDAQFTEKELQEQKPQEKEVERPLHKIPLLSKIFLKTCKKSLADMTRDELEEFCILKIGESVIDRSTMNEISAQLKMLSNTIEEYKKKANTLMKQNRDLQVVLKSVQEEQKKGTNTPVTPLKITRSVGMQVFMTEKTCARKKSQSCNSYQNFSPNKVPKSPTNQNLKGTKVQTYPIQQIPVPRLVPAVNNTASASNKTSAPAVPTKIQGGPVPNGVWNSHQIQKPEKRPHSKVQNSVTVDLTDDEPPAKIVQRTATTPVRLIPQQTLLNTQRPQFANNNNTPKKVYIPIGAAQNQVRPGQTIMLKQVSQGQRMRGPNIIAKQSVASPLRMTRIAPRHPAPLPDSMKQYQPPNWKALPPTPDIKLSKVDNGIVISWKINDFQEDDHEEIASYQLYAYQETSSPPSTALWKKIGDVKALPLPMACTLTQFMSGYKYYFAVRAVDIRSRLGPFSLPGSILLLNKM